MTLRLPLPPPYNRCVRRCGSGVYATKEYRDWLEIASGYLFCFMRDWYIEEPDAESSFDVEIKLFLGSRHGDHDAYSKQVFDVLAGKTTDGGGRVVDGRGIMANDRQIMRSVTDVVSTHNADPYVLVKPFRCAPPVNMQAHAKAARAAAREAARAAKKGGK
jgi:hypothetical protein